MALLKDDRIAFSKSIVESDFLKAGIDRAQVEIVKQQEKALALDEANKRLVDSRSSLVNGYHSELGYLSGIFRTTLTNQDQIDAANFVLGNHLYPNDPNNPPPSLAPGVWTKIKPYSRNKGVGKAYNENYPAVNPIGEAPLITSILSKIAAIETNYVLMERTTGQTCVQTGTCSNPSYTTQPTCVANGGTWTPGPDLISTYTALQNDLTSLVSDVTTMVSTLTLEQAAILTNDPDSARQTQNNAAIAAIPAVIANLNTWLGYANFNTAHGQTTCAGFFGYNAALLSPTKLYTTQLDLLKNTALARQTAIGTRTTQVQNNLGSITQNLTTGDSTGTGLYYERWRFIELRLNMVGGSLVEYLGYNRSIDGQNQLKSSYEGAKNTYLTLLRCSILSAPTNGTKVVNVKSSSGFSVGDNVYIVSDGQEELLRTIESISGNSLTLGQPVPAKYRPNEYARIYKDIS